MTRRGASLIWAMVMSTALLFIAVTTATFVIRESQMSIRMDESSLAYAAAESGIDWGKYCVQSLPQCKNLVSGTSFGPSTFYVGGSKYVVVVKKEASQTKIESIGTSNGVNRKLEHVLKSSDPMDRIPDSSLGATLQINGSYVQQFDYWAPAGTHFANIGLGDSSTAPTQGIYLKHIDVSGIPYIYLTTKNGAIIKETGLSLSGIDISAPYSLRVRIEYFKDLSAKMTVSKRNFDSSMPEFSCIGSELVVDVRDLGLSPVSFTNFYFNSALTMVTDTSKGDGSVQKLINGTSEAYFDNMAIKGATVNTPNYLLSVSKNTNNGTITSSSVLPASADLINCGSDCSGSYRADTQVSLTVVANVGYMFTGWSNCTTGTANPLLVSMTSDKTCVANFYRIVPVYWFTSTLEYFQSVDSTETGGGFYTLQGISYNTPEAGTPGAVLVTRYRSLLTGRHFWQIEATKEVVDGPVWDYEGPSFYVFPPGTPGKTPVYRYYLPSTDAHLYSTGYGNPTYAGYTYEGEVWRVY